MTDQPILNQAKIEAFAGKVLNEVSSATVTMLTYLGDRLNLFKIMADKGWALVVYHQARWWPIVVRLAFARSSACRLKVHLTFCIK